MQSGSSSVFRHSQMSPLVSLSPLSVIPAVPSLPRGHHYRVQNHVSELELPDPRGYRANHVQRAGHADFHRVHVYVVAHPGDLFLHTLPGHHHDLRNAPRVLHGNRGYARRRIHAQHRRRFDIRGDSGASAGVVSRDCENRGNVRHVLPRIIDAAAERHAEFRGIFDVIHDVLRPANQIGSFIKKYREEGSNWKTHSKRRSSTPQRCRSDRSASLGCIKTAMAKRPSSAGSCAKEPNPSEFDGISPEHNSVNGLTTFPESRQSDKNRRDSADSTGPADPAGISGVSARSVSRSFSNETSDWNSVSMRCLYSALCSHSLYASLGEPRFYGLGVSDPHELNKIGGKKWRHVILLVEKLVLQSHRLAEIVFQRIRIGGLRVTRNTIRYRGEGAHHLVELVGGALGFNTEQKAYGEIFAGVNADPVAVSVVVVGEDRSDLVTNEVVPTH